MSQEEMNQQAVLARLDRLEKQNRRIKWGSLTLFAALLAWLFTGQGTPTPSVVEAQRFVLKDAKGNVRAWLGLRGQGVELILGNANKQPKITMMTSEDDSDLHFFGSSKAGMTLGVNGADPAISAISGAGNGEMGLAYSSLGPALKLTDAKGLTVMMGPATAGNSAASSVQIVDPSGKVLWHAP